MSLVDRSLMIQMYEIYLGIVRVELWTVRSLWVIAMYVTF